jgi:hypothetical protein
MLIRSATTASAQPRWRPPTQPRAAHDRDHPRQPRPRHQAVPGSQSSGRQNHQRHTALPQAPPRPMLPPPPHRPRPASWSRAGSDPAAAWNATRPDRVTVGTAPSPMICINSESRKKRLDLDIGASFPVCAGRDPASRRSRLSVSRASVSSSLDGRLLRLLRTKPARGPSGFCFDRIVSTEHASTLVRNAVLPGAKLPSPGR